MDLLFIINRLKVEGDCIIWTGAKNNNGRPIMTKGGKRINVVKDIYKRFTERNPPDSCHIVNICGRKDCVNPHHIEFSYVRGNTILNAEQVKEIREKRGRDPGTFSLTLLSRLYKVSTATIWSIINNKTWKTTGKEEDGAKYKRNIRRRIDQ